MSCVSSNCIKACCGATLIGTTAFSYLAGAVFISTAYKVSEAYLEHCQGNITAVSSPFGETTCKMLGGLVSYQDIMAGIFTWCVPLLAAGTGALITYHRMTRKVRQIKTPEAELLINQEDY